MCLYDLDIYIDTQGCSFPEMLTSLVIHPDSVKFPFLTKSDNFTCTFSNSLPAKKKYYKQKKNPAFSLIQSVLPKNE